MPIDDEFLKKLRCPRTHRPLRAMTDEERGRLEAAIRAGNVTTAGGRRLEMPLAEGLVPEGEEFVYPVDGGIPILLAEEAVPLP